VLIGLAIVVNEIVQPLLIPGLLGEWRWRSRKTWDQSLLTVEINTITTVSPMLQPHSYRNLKGVRHPRSIVTDQPQVVQPEVVSSLFVLSQGSSFKQQATSTW